MQESVPSAMKTMTGLNYNTVDKKLNEVQTLTKTLMQEKNMSTMNKATKL